MKMNWYIDDPITAEEAEAWGLSFFAGAAFRILLEEEDEVKAKQYLDKLMPWQKEKVEEVARSLIRLTQI